MRCIVALVALLSCGSALAQDRDTNLIQNPGAEAGITAEGDNSVLTFWNHNPGGGSASYGASDFYGNPTKPYPADGENLRFFHGGALSGGGGLRQELEITDAGLQGDIDANLVTFLMNGFFGSSFVETAAGKKVDLIQFTVQFLDGAGALIKTVGPLRNAYQPGFIVDGIYSEFRYASDSAVVPRNTRKVVFNLRFIDTNGDGKRTSYADLLEFKFKSNFSSSTLLERKSDKLFGAKFGTDVALGWQAIGRTSSQVETLGGCDWDGDGADDVAVMNPITRRVGFYILRFGGIADYVNGPLVATGWNVLGVTDMDSDGRSDVVIQNTLTREIGAYLMTGGHAQMNGGSRQPEIVGWHKVSQVPDAGTEVVGLTDLDNDGHTDVVFKTANDRLGFWRMIEGQFAEWRVLMYLAVGWFLAGYGDANLDGRTDIYLKSPTRGLVGYWTLLDLVIQGWRIYDRYDSTNWDVKAVGQF